MSGLEHNNFSQVSKWQGLFGVCRVACRVYCMYIMKVNWIIYTVHCTVYSIQCTVYHVHYTVSNVYCTLYNTIISLIKLLRIMIGI